MLKRSLIILVIVPLLFSTAIFAQSNSLAVQTFSGCEITATAGQSLSSFIFASTCGRIEEPNIIMHHMKLDEFYAFLAAHTTDPFRQHELLYGDNIIWAATVRDQQTATYTIYYWGDISDLTLTHEIMHVVLWELFPEDIAYTQDEQLIWLLTNHFIQSKNYKNWLRAQGI